MYSIDFLGFAIDLEFITNLVVIISVIGSPGVYFFKLFRSNRELRRDFSQTLKIEIKYNKERLNNIIDAGYTNKTWQYDNSWFRTNVYDGIVCSGNIRYFKPPLQSELHTLYITNHPILNFYGLIINMDKLLDCMIKENVTLIELFKNKLNFNKR